ncbi:MAG: GntR family transcriptional regulator [Devosia sp.]|uniref:MocR-like pyridoxine biosynthesis transcription factor PdxR n=1 Tax=Devosia sp. TaxID=1871048 RepID=UPI0026092B53|nr:PLP-dependent aminotransferase family protein [Devosia sp.]MDB5529521.1 GntR family transcriptional regulator [Devosia sp.]
MTSRQTELLIGLNRDHPATLRAQIETQLREAIRAGSLKTGVVLPSSRELSRQLAVSRPLVSEAYAQLAAEGYLAIRQGALPVVTAASNSDPQAPLAAAAKPAAAPLLRYDFRIGLPDLTSFPKSLWLKATGKALAQMEPNDFGYGDRHGVLPLRVALADYLGRVRGVIATPDQIVVTGGFEASRSLFARALRKVGVAAMAIEDPGHTNLAALIAAGLELVKVPVDAFGIDIEKVTSTTVAAALVTPSHQYPTGVVLSPERRHNLLAWLRERNGFVLEDDYDAEFRYDRRPVAALQGLDPNTVVYAGTASKALAPALRLGWLVVPHRLLEDLQAEQRISDYGVSRIDQHALAVLITSGEYDRHLRRMRLQYRRRRQMLINALAEFMPDATVTGIAAGLHASVTVPRHYDEEKFASVAARMGLAVSMLTHHFIATGPASTTLLVGFSTVSESNIRPGIRALATALAYE